MDIYITDNETIACSLAKYLFSSDYAFDSSNIHADSKAALVYTKGSLYQLFDAKDYDIQHKPWNLDQLPIIPKNFQFKLKYNRQSIIDDIAAHIKPGSSIYNCGMAEEKSQFDIDLLIRNLSFNGDIFRILLDDQTEQGVKKAFADITSNQNYRSISMSGYCRYIADWLLGVNFTRLYTILAKQQGYHSPIYIGRVKTTIFSMIHKRCIEISTGKDQAYFNESSLLEELKANTSEFFYSNGINISGIINKLVSTGFIQYADSKLISTSLGNSIYNALPSFFKSTAITKEWEEKLKAVSSGTLNHDEFVKEIACWIQQEITALIEIKPEIIIEEQDVCRCKCNSPLIKRIGKRGAYWECTNTLCRQTYSNKNKKPVFKQQSEKQLCPKCKKGKLKQTTLNGNPGLQLKKDIVISCDQFPNCNYTKRNGYEQ